MKTRAAVDRAGRGHQHREHARAVVGREQHALVARDRRHRRQRVHALSARDARHQLHRQQRRAGRGDLMNRLGRTERIREPDQRLTLSQSTAWRRRTHRQEDIGAVENVGSAEDGRALLDVGIVGKPGGGARPVSTATSMPAFLSAAAPAGITATRSRLAKSLSESPLSSRQKV
jgi:hypothetical protein